MNFTLKQLRYFEAALRCGSIANASAELGISQSSITAAIDAMEQTVEADLFRRIPAKGIVPTETGKQVGERVVRFLEQARIFEADLMSVGRDPIGTLRMGCYEPTAPYVLPPLLSRIAQTYPAIRIELVEGNLQEVTDQLRSGAVDVTLTYRRAPVRGLPFDSLFVARPWAVLPLGSPLAGRQSVRMRDLAPLPMVMLDMPTTAPYFM